MSALNLVDRTGSSPGSYRVRERAPSEVDLAALHQTGTPPGLGDALLDRTRAHALVLDSGEVRHLHGWLTRLRYGSGPWNARCVSVEVRANLPGRYWRGEPRWAGSCPPERWDADSRRAQVLAARALLARLRDELPGLRYVGAHRLVEAGKGGCPGPDLWREVGEWALSALGLELAPTHARGRALPDDWRREPTIADVAGATEAGRADGCGREYGGPLAALPGPSAFVQEGPADPSGPPPLAGSPHRGGSEI